VPQIVARILLAVLLVPLALLFDLIAYLVIERANIFYFSRSAAWACNLMTAIILAVGWILIWLRQVSWTKRRRKISAIALIAAALVGGLLYHLIQRYFDIDVGIFVGCTGGALLFMLASTFVWRETATERSGRMRHTNVQAVVCPACNYNLSGLCEARCPECGARYTLDELLALQPQRGAAAIEGAMSAEAKSPAP
jgi:hypothetical protein